MSISDSRATAAKIIVAPTAIKSILGSSWDLGSGVGVCKGVVEAAGVGVIADVGVGVGVVFGVEVGALTSNISMFMAL